MIMLMCDSEKIVANVLNRTFNYNLYISLKIIMN